MLPQRIILGIGLAILLLIGAASIGLDLKSRADTASVDHALEVLKRISDIRPLLRRAESAARGFALTGNPDFVKEYNESSDAILPAFDDLIKTVEGNPGQTRLIEEAKAQVARQIVTGGELIRLKNAGDQAKIAALLSNDEDRKATETIGENLAKTVAEERRRLTLRRTQSETNGGFLLAVDLACVLLILILATVLTRSSGRSRRELQESLTATKATNEALEAAVAERTGHLVTAHEELRHSTEVMQSTFHSMAEAVLVIDAKGRVLLSNPAAEKMLRYRPGMTVELLRQLSTVFRADGVTPLPTREMPAARALRGEEFDATEIVVRPKSGSAPVHLVISGRPLRDASRAISGAALLYHDITATREIERKLQQSQKLDAIGKLTGGVAHDFNNMLTVITGTTERLVAALEDQPALKKTAELIDVAAERCIELIQHLLAFARRQPLQPRNIDVNGTVLDIAKLLRPTLGEHIEIDSILEPEVAAAHIDPSQLANSLLNMAINARDAMPEGGKLLLETRNVVLDQAYAQANPDVLPGPYVMLAVSDTGTGMSKEIQDKVFEPFFTTKEVGKGTGLGMSMVYGFVKQSGGHIRVYSEEGHGTTIKLYLPPARGQAPAAVAAAAPLVGGAETILVVEDDDLVRNFVTTQLQTLGYQTLDTADGPSALQAVKNGLPFDLLFTDVILPNGMSGRQLADEVVKHRPGIRVLYTSGYTDNAIVHQGRLDPGVLLLSKPYRKSQLAKMIRQALD
ncbi:CHASE3 domain-containing protein [Bradyrhizobium sp. AUGA SZCCT0240]|uniref:CHASE3 domain-containing protein n=1 Tax=unclassified Bradyrhizobium TaxID=2631580 RepID=UPI001BABC8D7|nr:MULTISPECIES: CHASE3 domain-containing protein [unclassified Bradyrhizobium]MBR1198990.1 CHASE3 domain-containing protein [Bradyrhizobium sp. AUGA SZCCT0158]MBR1239619.1 CHASE3 domain-containing protein [Bradyrhizobium sp. AUGA SZCCT0274]MBR1247094.1 CHASE3 domain-containing protein [Bradyrhizobium sp. AUGA SZCCT0169]MBR1257588.1 CHASE3 domain-containing protein [Bradyrhizobium sp. AUGA SZCCT0240]